MAIDITPFIKPAQDLQEKTGIPASVTLAQIMKESSGSYAGGMSGLATSAKNLFGMKGTGTAGTTSMKTGEVYNGKSVIVSAGFRKYNSYDESISDYGKLLSTERYASKLKNATSIEQFVQGIKDGGYATDPNYVTGVLNLIKSNNLQQYDNKTLKFKGDSSVSVSGTGATSTTSSKGDDTGSMVTKVFYQGVRVILFATIFILAVIFFMRAFPAVEDVASTVTPIKKVTKVSKKVLKK